MSFEAFIAKIPLGSSRAAADDFKGSWLGYYLRMVASYFVPPEEACKIVVLAIGPGHDYVPLGKNETTGYEYAWDGNIHHAPKGTDA